MAQVSSFLGSSVGSKAIVGLTGLGLALFVFAHMAGNMLMFISPEAYNLYGHALTSNPLIYLAEAGLVAFFLFHAVKGILLTVKNWGAKSSSYSVSGSGDKKTSLVTKTLWLQGSLILVFVILHLNTFKFGTIYDVTYDGKTVRDLHRLVIEVFQQPGYVVWYIVCLIPLGFHLGHGLASSFQTLGWNTPKHAPKLKVISWVYGAVVAGGFISQPLYVFLIH